MRGIITLAALVALSAALPAGAQSRSRGNGGVPPGQRPPAGMCRVRIDGVPPGRQPRPTDCSTAVANVPSNGRVIWGDQTASRRVYNSGVYDSRVYDPRHNVYNANGDVVSPAPCTRQVVNGVVRTVCHQHRFNRNNALKREKKHDKDDRDHLRRPGDNDRDDHDRFNR